MITSKTNPNWNDQLIQLVSFQLLSKTNFKTPAVCSSGQTIITADICGSCHSSHDTVPTSGCEACRPRATKPGHDFTHQCSSHYQEQHHSIRDWPAHSCAEWGYCCRVLAAEDCHQLSVGCPTDSTGHDIGSGITSFCGAPVFSLWFANRRQAAQQDGEITEHASMAQSQLWWTAGLAVDCRVDCLT